MNSTPFLTTATSSSITNTTATLGGNVTIDGGAAVTARGICWSTNANPTIALATKTLNGTGAGSFTSNITGLTANTTYYVRAYATNSLGTSYGNQQIFTTSNTNSTSLPNITIGSQVWTTQNLSEARYRNGDVIPQVTVASQWNSLTTGAWCWYNNDSATYAATYGRLYNWYAVNDSRGLCPTGWHVPTAAEWLTLYTTLGSSSAGIYMKSARYISPNTPIWDQGDGTNTGTNLSGFTGLPGGILDNYNGYMRMGYGGYWWSSTETDETQANSVNLGNDRPNLAFAALDKVVGMSVRCIRD
jgi:uncharacterized protein (TIGR02145 family)